MTLSSDRQPFYRNVVYLNNAAASLMVRGDGRASLDALKGALQQMGSVVAVDKSNECPKTTAAIEDTERMMARNAQTLSLSSSCIVTPPSFVRVVTLDGCSIQEAMIGVCSANDDETTLATAHAGVFIRLDNPPECDHEFMEELVPAMLLSNFALSHLAVVGVAATSTQPCCDPFLDQILCLLNMAQTILRIHDMRFEDVSEARLLAAIVVWNNMYTVLQTASVRNDERLARAMLKLQSLQMLARCFWIDPMAMCLEGSKPASAA